MALNLEDIGKKLISPMKMKCDVPSTPMINLVSGLPKGCCVTRMGQKRAKNMKHSLKKTTMSKIEALNDGSV